MERHAGCATSNSGGRSPLPASSEATRDNVVRYKVTTESLERHCALTEIQIDRPKSRPASSDNV